MMQREYIKLSGKWTNVLIINIFLSLESIGLISLSIVSWNYYSNSSGLKISLLVYTVIFTSNCLFGFFFIKNHLIKVIIFSAIVLLSKLLFFIFTIALLFLRTSMAHFIFSKMPESYNYYEYLWSIVNNYMAFAIIFFVLDIILYLASIAAIFFYAFYLNRIKKREKKEKEDYGNK